MPTIDDGHSNHNDARTAAQRLTILVVDDDAFRESLRIWPARDGGWEVLEATDGEEALAELDDTVDAVVLDRRMPNYSGPEVLERPLFESFEGPVIVMSAFEPDAHLNEKRVAEYLTKPIGRQEFLDVLERVVR